jgi:hypothetical protein
MRSVRADCSIRPSCCPACSLSRNGCEGRLGLGKSEGGCAKSALG